MAIETETKSTAFMDFFTKHNAFEEILEEGPAEDEEADPQLFLDRAEAALTTCVAAFEAITPQDVDEEYFEEGD